MTNLDPINSRLLDQLQSELPLVGRPFAQIGQRIGLHEAEVIERVSSLRHGPRPVIRQISAIFDSRSLGYESCLVAAKVDESRLENAAQEISRHPGVSHNYRRDHAYNLWYTIAIPPDSALGLQRTVDILHEKSGAIASRLMPALKVFKIGVKFNLGGDEAPASATSARFGAAEGTKLTETDKRMIRSLQQDLPLLPEPFELWAAQAGVSVEQLLAAAKSYQEQGLMRRFSAVLKHREAGFSANAMGAWVVPDQQQDAFGKSAAGFSAVSHCYLRPSYPDWPYSIFTMVHGRQRDECEAVLAEISRATGITNYAALYSTHEYKKIRVKYFTGDIERWESEQSQLGSSFQQGVSHACNC